MTSHALPQSVFRQLTRLVKDLDLGLQVCVHDVERARDISPAFEQGYVTSTMLRSQISAVAADVAEARSVRFHELGNGGGEFILFDEGVERRFRLRRARFNPRGQVEVTVSSDSFLTKTAVGMTRSLFGDDEFDPPYEQWVLAYVLDRVTLTFRQIYAGLPIGIAGDRIRAPYTLSFGDSLVRIPLTTATPPRFDGEREDLDIDDEPSEDEEGGEVA